MDLPDTATCLVYPDGKQYRTQLASAAYVGVVRERLGDAAAAEWKAFQAEVERLFQSAGAVQPIAVRLDDGAAPLSLPTCHFVAPLSLPAFHSVAPLRLQACPFVVPLPLCALQAL